MKILLKLLSLSAFYFCYTFADSLEDRVEFAKKSKVFCSRPLHLESDEEQKWFCDKLKELKGIERLDIRWLGINKETVNCVAKFIKDNRSSLKIIDLCDNNIGDDVIQKIANGLKNSSVEVIRLENCNLGDKAIRIITQILPYIPNLRKLILNRNGFITDKGGHALLYELPNTEMLTYIGTSYTGISREVKQAILKELAQRYQAYSARTSLYYIRRKRSPSRSEQPVPKRRCTDGSRAKDLYPDTTTSVLTQSIEQNSIRSLYILAEVASQRLESEQWETIEGCEEENFSYPSADSEGFDDMTIRKPDIEGMEKDKHNN